MKVGILLAGVAFLAGVGAAHAQDATVVPVDEAVTVEGTGWYLSVFGAGMWPHVAQFNYVGKSDVYDIATAPGWLAGGSIGVRVMDVGRLELEASYSSQAWSSVEAFVSAGRIHTASLLGNFWFDMDTGTTFTPYVGGGVGGARVILDDFGGYFDSPSVWAGFGVAYQVGGGVIIDLGENVSMDVGYRYRGLVKSTVVNFRGFDGNPVIGNHVVQVGLNVGL